MQLDDLLHMNQIFCWQIQPLLKKFIYMAFWLLFSALSRLSSIKNLYSKDSSQVGIAACLQVFPPTFLYHITKWQILSDLNFMLIWTYRFIFFFIFASVLKQRPHTPKH